MDESSIDQVCLRIYAKHYTAINLLNERLEGRQVTLGRNFADLIRQEPKLVLHKPWRNWTIFGVKRWDVSALRAEEQNGYAQYALLFNIEDHGYKVVLTLHVQEGHAEKIHSLFAMARAHQPPFVVTDDDSEPYTPLYTRTILSPEDALTKGMGETIAHIQEQWSVFLTQGLPLLDTLIRTWARQHGGATLLGKAGKA